MANIRAVPSTPVAIRIDKGVPIQRNGAGRAAKYSWREMNIGDSFFVPNVTLKSMSGHYSGAAIRLGVKFCGRTVEGGVRVWRVA